MTQKCMMHKQIIEINELYKNILTGSCKNGLPAT